MNGKEKKEKPIVKVPKSTIGRVMFTGAQLAGAVSVVRSLRAARAKDDKLALLHAVFNAGVVIVTALIAVRTIRETKRAAEFEAAEPRMLTAGK